MKKEKITFTVAEPSPDRGKKSPDVKQFILWIEYKKRFLANVFFYHKPKHRQNLSTSYKNLCEKINKEIGIEFYDQKRKEKRVWRIENEADIKKLEALAKEIAQGHSPTQTNALYPDEVDASKKYPEGAVQKVTVNKYERSPAARKECIDKYGTSCSVCGTDFGKVYGEIGEGFIHVHHLIPLSELGAGYKINPIKELRPVCPNCHAMLHRKKPPYDIEELKEILKK